MIILSITGFFRMMLYILVIYMLVRFFTRLLLPVVMEDYVKTEKRRIDREREAYYKAEKKKEGKISIDPGSSRRGKRKGMEGEYVDYEEVK